MKKFQFWFTNNVNNFLDTVDVTEENRSILAESYFETDNIEHFVCMHTSIIENPISMWYWVIVDSDVHISGAIDSGDVEYFDEIPDVKNFLDNINKI